MDLPKCMAGQKVIASARIQLRSLWDWRALLSDVNLSEHEIEDISIKFVIRRWETEDILRHGPECGHMACRSVYKASILPAMAFSIYGATANVHGLIFA